MLEIEKTKNTTLVYFVATVHTMLIFLNFISIPLLVTNEPFWIWTPLLTFLASPLLGGQFCIFNRIENFYREKAGMPKIVDRVNEIWKIFIKSGVIE